MEPVKEKVRALGLERDVRFTGVRSDVPELLWAMDCLLYTSLCPAKGKTVEKKQESAGTQWENGLYCWCRQHWACLLYTSRCV